ncbi:hypothetical protein [Rhodococcus tukisamuensis]|uniref:Tetratricopeptide repeat-containing protein n=1 Tax=Rhodococcus tukisamuensis TaxID=168276 RepID=A0A1G6VVZ8_9NOCA|nr:hypothetical protein [Rhodococcus tukisamuensis]SDD57704.1 hypothetical protein SAMN05444580_105153 [Rhodococcus tukisamuensis]
MNEPDPIMTAITAAQQLATVGDRAGARAAFATLWEQVGPDGDPPTGSRQRSGVPGGPDLR